ncbi:MAG: beta-glucosidase [Spirochaetales bacterium]
MNIDAVLSALTIEEKASLCSGAGPWSTVAVDRLSIESVTMSDGPHGIRSMKDKAVADLGASKPATCFPTAGCLGSSWDRELVERVGEAIAEEARELGCNLVLGPGMNVKRSPLCGRNFEYYSEDPVLSGDIASAFVRGLQSRGVGATLKHFVCNNTEFERMSLNVQVDERPLRELYLAGFKRAIDQSNPWAVMAAYNRVNGEFACEHAYLLQAVLNEEWGYEGLIVSDWTAVNDRVEAVRSGLDLEMPGPSETNDRRLAAAVRDGLLEESVLDSRLRKILKLVERAQSSGIDTTRSSDNPDEEALERHHDTARKAAAESAILLKNEYDVLPFEPGQVERLAVIGRFAETPRFQGGGSSKVNAARLESVCSVLGVSGDHGARSGAGTIFTFVEFAPGYDEDGAADAWHIDGATRAAGSADAALLVVGLPDAVESEGFDRESLSLPEGQAELIQAVCNSQPNTAVAIVAGSVVSVEKWIDSAPAVVMTGLAGQASGGALVDVVTGTVNPSGRLTETLPKSIEHTAVHLNYPGENGAVRYGEGLFVGYRFHDETGVAPRYPFGHGISYTQFEYGQPELTVRKRSSADGGPGRMHESDTLTVRVPITNIGERAGAEVVQLYIAPPTSRLRRPVRALRGFTKVKLAASESGIAEFSVTREDFAYYDPAFSRWIVESGEYTLQIGSTSADIRRTSAIHIDAESTPDLPLTEWSPIRDWVSDEAGRKAFDDAIGVALIDSLSGGRKAEREMFLNIPLKKVPQLTGGQVSEDTLEDLLSRVSQKREDASK